MRFTNLIASLVSMSDSLVIQRIVHTIIYWLSYYFDHWANRKNTWLLVVSS